MDLASATSRIGPIANLYGNGLPQMLRNLLWNPQIRQIVILGKNLSGSREWLLNFFEHGLEEVEFLGAKAYRIRNTTRTIDGCVQPSHFAYLPEFKVLGDVGDPATKAGLKDFFRRAPGISGARQRRACACRASADPGTHRHAFPHRAAQPHHRARHADGGVVGDHLPPVPLRPSQHGREEERARRPRRTTEHQGDCRKSRGGNRRHPAAVWV